MIFPAGFFFLFIHVSQIVEDLDYLQDSRSLACLCLLFLFENKEDR